MSFGQRITDIRIKKGLSLRQVAVKCLSIDSSLLSKIERGIQNPYNKKEFQELIKALDITDPKEIAELEKLAMEFIPEKELSDSELMQHMPAFLPPDFDESKTDKLIDIIKDSQKPSPQKKD